MYWLQKLKIIDKSPVWLSKAEQLSNCSWQSYCMAVTNHWQFSCMALSLKKSLTILLFGFQKSLTIFLYGFELVNNHWQTSCMAVTNHWQMSIMALSQKVDKITGNSWQNYCNSLEPIQAFQSKAIIEAFFCASLFHLVWHLFGKILKVSLKLVNFKKWSYQIA